MVAHHIAETGAGGMSEFTFRLLIVGGGWAVLILLFGALIRFLGRKYG